MNNKRKSYYKKKDWHESPDPNHRLGVNGEDLTAKYMTEKMGMVILERNVRYSPGEIDIVAWQDNLYVFVEVKYRKNDSYGQPYAYVSLSKIRKICHAASFYLFRNKLNEYTPCRFDVISILGNEITHMENAFEYVR